MQRLLKSNILVLGYWYGIELEKPHGKNDGSVGGVQYFSCSPRYGIFAPPSRVQRWEKWNLCFSTRPFCNLQWFIVKTSSFYIKDMHWLQLVSSFKGLTNHLLQREGSWKAKFALLRICNFKTLLYSSFANPMSMCRLLEVAFAAKNSESSELNLSCKQK